MQPGYDPQRRVLPRCSNCWSNRTIELLCDLRPICNKSVGVIHRGEKMDAGYIAAISGLVGALIGSASSIATIVIQSQIKGQARSIEANNGYFDRAI